MKNGSVKAIEIIKTQVLNGIKILKLSIRLNFIARVKFYRKYLKTNNIMKMFSVLFYVEIKQNEIR